MLSVDASYISNRYLDTVLNWMPAMKGIHLKDVSTFLRTTNSNDFMVNFFVVKLKELKELRPLF